MSRGNQNFDKEGNITKRTVKRMERKNEREMGTDRHSKREIERERVCVCVSERERVRVKLK